MIAWLIVTDGRDEYLEQAVRSGRDNLDGWITERWMYDDTGDDEYRAELKERFPSFTHINGGGRQGFGGAIRSAWNALTWNSTAKYVFHHEQDFTFNETIDLDAIATVLDNRIDLVQMALRRQPWNPEEIAAGGVVEQYSDSYTECSNGSNTWLEHRRFFTTNPCLYRRSLCAEEWPDSSNSEGLFGFNLAEDPDVRFGFWGGFDSAPKVHHIGAERTGHGY